MRRTKVWPHLTLIAVACALVGGVAAALWFRNEPKTEAFASARAARVERVDGEVGLERGTGNDSEDRWEDATPNSPLTVGDRVYARDDSMASIAFTGRNYARLHPNSSLDVLTLSDRRTQLALRNGSAIFDLGALEDGEMFEVATPRGAFALQRPGLYEVGYDDDGRAWVSVLSGLAQVVGLAGSGDISKGEMLTLLGQTAADIALSRISPDYAGGLLDDYYGYQYPDIYDGRYADYNAYLADPSYYDPYNRYTSYRYTGANIPGVRDLDYYGDWRQLDGYGYAWSPRVDAGWAPYRQGYWALDEPFGLTWVSTEPWGYAPYHYGRWANVGGQWYWVPEGVQTQPAYAPALVAFVPLADSNQIAWVPLAPGEQYVPVYYDANWQPHYAGGSQPVYERVANFAVPGALTVVPVDQFGRVIDPRTIAKVHPHALEGARPLAEPFSNAILRQAALRTANERRGFVLPPGLAKKLDETRVLTIAEPLALRFRKERKAFRAELIPEKQKKQKLEFRDERHTDSARHTDAPGQAGKGRGRWASPEAVRGETEARGRAQKAERKEAAAPQVFEQPQPVRAPRAESEKKSKKAEQGARGERVGQSQQPTPQQQVIRESPPQQQQKAERGQGGGGGGQGKDKGPQGKGKGRP